MDSIIHQTASWFAAVGQQPAEPTPNVRQVAFYVGMQLEELGEKVAAIEPLMGAQLKHWGEQYKEGHLDTKVSEAMADPTRAHELFDGDMDLLWVSIGGARALGCNPGGGFGVVYGANWGKQWADGTFHKDSNGKVIKPPGWRAPDLTEFMHPSLCFQPGDVVQASPGFALRSGASMYSDAVVACGQPLVLVSRTGDMVWSTVKPGNVYRTEQKADAETMAVVNERYESWRE